MFCATFYSYKGGVGRTMALANVAIVLAKRGKRVLVVDMDLEAPGLTTLEPFEDAGRQRGFVEFVQDYVQTGDVPVASEYIRRCEVVDPYAEPLDPLLEIDVMPAGLLDDGYPGRFGSLDWGRLYGERDGFLLMEDLRRQWGAAGYDYVLIDSRTGLTDIGGICTRQLPDAVVAVFFPNEQNLAGLRQVVPTIRENGARKSPIEVIFAASRVPRLDDEHNVLRDWLARFQTALKYEARDLTIIEHYDSLALLDQKLFVLDRPNSGLAQQYGELSAALSQHNVEDADGALRYLRKVTAGRARSAKSGSDTLAGEDAIIDRMAAIAKRHIGDFVVQRALAVTYHRLRRLLDAAAATDNALAAYGSTATTEPVSKNLLAGLHQMRIRIFTELGDVEEMTRSAERVLSDVTATDVMTLDALMALASTEPDRLPDPGNLPALDGSDREGLIAVARRLAAFPAAARIAAAIAEKAVRAGDIHALASGDAHHLQLALIAGGAFETAVELGESELNKSPGDLPTLFNTTMARWGRDGRPDLEMCERLAALVPSDNRPETEANPPQCLALLMAVLGRSDEAETYARTAAARIRATGARELSCWTFIVASPAEFEEHCEAIVALARQEGSPPEFVRVEPAWAVSSSNRV